MHLAHFDLALTLTAAGAASSVAGVAITLWLHRRPSRRARTEVVISRGRVAIARQEVTIAIDDDEPEADGSGARDVLSDIDRLLEASSDLDASVFAALRAGQTS